MIRGLTTIKRSTVAAPAKLFHRNDLSDFTKLQPLVRNFNTYHPQPFPYYGGQVNSCQYDPYQRYYANRNAYQLSPNFAHFHPGVYGPHPRFGYQFRGDFSPYPVGGAWRSFGPEYRCRCCGCQQFLPVNYGGNMNWYPNPNPNAGMCRGGVVQGNGYVDQGIDYNRGDWSQMRRDTARNNTGGGRANFNGNDCRNLWPYGANSSDFPRNQNVNERRDYNANQNQNVGQHRPNLGDSYNERQEVPRVNGFEEQKIVHDGYRRPQDEYRWNNHNFTENDGRDGRDQVASTQSRSSYNHYGPEHSFHSESERLNQGTRYVDRKNVNTDNQNRPANSGGAIDGQFQNSTVNGRPLNSNGAGGGGGEEYWQTGQSSRVPDVLRKDNNHDSNEHNWSVNSQSGSDYSRDEVMCSNGHDNLNRPRHENSKPFQQNLNSSDFPRNRNENGGRDYNANQNQNVGQHRQNLGDSYNERQGVPRVNGFEEQKIAHHDYRRPRDAYRYNHNFTENDGRDGRDQVAWTQSRSSYNSYGPEHSFHSDSRRLNQGTGYVDQKNVSTDNQTTLANNGGAVGGQFQNSTVNECPMNSIGAGGGEEYKRAGQSSRVPDVLRKDNNHNNGGAIGGQFQNSTVNERPLNSNGAGGGEEYKQTGLSFTSQFRSDYIRDEVMSSCGPENLNRPGHDNSKAFQQILNLSHGKILNGNPIGGQYEKRFNVASDGEASRIFQDNKGAKQDSVIAWDDDESWNESDLGNLYDPLPDFIANEPLNPSKTNAQMPNINDSNDATRMSIDASRRCRQIIDLLESEDE